MTASVALRKPNVHNRVIADNDLGHVIEANTLNHTAEVHAADPNVADAYGRTALYALVDIRNFDWSALPERKADYSTVAISTRYRQLDESP